MARKAQAACARYGGRQTGPAQADSSRRKEGVMKTEMKRGGWVLAGVLLGLSMIVCAGCTPIAGLNQVMSTYQFTAISPPQSNWENGSIVEMEPGCPNAPVLHATPSMVPVSIANIDHDAPDVSQDFNEKLELSLGVSLPDNIKAQLTAQGVRQYSAVAAGNVLQSVALDSYVTDTFPKIVEKFGRNWTRALAEGRLYYFYEVWLCSRLTYKFYDDKGATAKITVPIQIPADLSAGWTANNDGSLVFSGPGVLCLGYRARPVRASSSGEPVPMATGGMTAAVKQASEKLDKPQESAPPK